jgi:hypothetical protein
MYPIEVATVLQGHQHAAWDLASGRIMPCDKEIGYHRDGLVMGEALAVRFGGHQSGNPV